MGNIHLGASAIRRTFDGPSWETQDDFLVAFHDSGDVRASFACILQHS